MTHASTPRSAVTTACRSTDLVLKDRPKSRKVSKIRTVSNIHRTTRLEPPTEDTTSNTAVAVEEEQAQPEPAVPAQAVQPPVPARGRSRHPWPYGSGMPGFGAYRGTTPTVRSRTSTMIRRDKRQHQMPRKTQFPLLALPSDTEKLKRVATPSSQNSSRMTSPLMTTKSTVVLAR